MTQKAQSDQIPSLKCLSCHHDKMIIRQLHWLKVFERCSKETSQDLMPHLLTQYPDNGKPWCVSILAWCNTIRSMWGSNGHGKLPLWVAWIKSLAVQKEGK